MSRGEICINQICVNTDERKPWCVAENGVRALDTRVNCVSQEEELSTEKTFMLGVDFTIRYDSLIQNNFIGSLVICSPLYLSLVDLC